MSESAPPSSGPLTPLGHMYQTPEPPSPAVTAKPPPLPDKSHASLSEDHLVDRGGKVVRPRRSASPVLARRLARADEGLAVTAGVSRQSFPIAHAFPYTHNLGVSDASIDPSDTDLKPSDTFPPQTIGVVFSPNPFSNRPNTVLEEHRRASMNSIDGPHSPPRPIRPPSPPRPLKTIRPPTGHGLAPVVTAQAQAASIDQAMAALMGRPVRAVGGAPGTVTQNRNSGSRNNIERAEGSLPSYKRGTFGQGGGGEEGHSHGQRTSTGNGNIHGGDEASSCGNGLTANDARKKCPRAPRPIRTLPSLGQESLPNVSTNPGDPSSPLGHDLRSDDILLPSEHPFHPGSQSPALSSKSSLNSEQRIEQLRDFIRLKQEDYSYSMDLMHARNDELQARVRELEAAAAATAQAGANTTSFLEVPNTPGTNKRPRESDMADFGMELRSGVVRVVRSLKDLTIKSTRCLSPKDEDEAVPLPDGPGALNAVYPAVAPMVSVNEGPSARTRSKTSLGLGMTPIAMEVRPSSSTSSTSQPNRGPSTRQSAQNRRKSAIALEARNRGKGTDSTLAMSRRSTSSGGRSRQGRPEPQDLPPARQPKRHQRGNHSD